MKINPKIICDVKKEVADPARFVKEQIALEDAKNRFAEIQLRALCAI